MSARPWPPTPQAIHPGYGFLSENAGFAALCKEHGVVFIGPPAEVISNMGDKDAARRLMKQNNVPTTPGHRHPAERPGGQGGRCQHRLSRAD